MKKIIFLFLLSTGLSFCQTIAPAILQKYWQAGWIAVPNASKDGYGVYLFRKTLDLTTKPDRFIIHVSADNRYKLYVNEKLVSLGPARGDLGHWHFETLDIASYLKTGKNIIATQVWNEAETRPEAQITAMTGFILQGNTKAEHVLNSNNTWKCTQDSSYAPLRVSNIKGYYVAGAGEIRQMAQSPKNWQALNFDDRVWKPAKFITNGLPRDNYEVFGASSQWMLVPSGIPQMEMTPERLQKIVNVDGNLKVTDQFLQKKSDLTIPANTTVTLLLDQNHLTNAYPNVLFSAGKNTSISLAYAEALYIKTNAMNKGNRNETQGKFFIGREDKIISDGSTNQHFTTLNYRTYRYIQVKIKTENEALTIHDIYGIFTGYPFQLKAKLATTDAEMSKILAIGWQTARLCATETYMDCPYYEQLQYIGDARIQALVTLYNTGDERMVKNALNLMDYSRQPEGITESRHPSYSPQYIPTFSLWYIGMLHDYAHYGSDSGFVKKKISGTRQILEYFKNYQQTDGSLKGVPFWMFSDWVDKYDTKVWQAGVAPIGADGTSAPIDLQLLLAYQTAADLEKKLGIPTLNYQSQIDLLKKTIRAKYWDSSQQLLADRTEKDHFSQHANALAILTDVVTPQEALQISNQLISNVKLAPASIYFKYYLHLALTKAGLGNDYMKWIDKWRENIKMGLTTWAEISEVDIARSDCHAWGASPNIEFYRIVLGIDSDAIGFSKIKIEPHLGNIDKIGGEIPHPNGTIKVNYELTNGKLKADVELPQNTTGRFVWQGKTTPLKAGKNVL